MTDNILNSINIFSELSDEECKSFQKFFKPRNYLKNSMIILEEEYGDLVFVVQSGTIKITRVNDEGKEVILALLGPGEIFGELAILDGEARSANALAQENCKLLAINKEDFLVVSGIGCSSRFPYYMDTFGFHTIHGRAPAVATGAKLSNPKLSVSDVSKNKSE